MKGILFLPWMFLAGLMLVAQKVVPQSLSTGQQPLPRAGGQTTVSIAPAGSGTPAGRQVLLKLFYAGDFDGTGVNAENLTLLSEEGLRLATSRRGPKRQCALRADTVYALIDSARLAQWAADGSIGFRARTTANVNPNALCRQNFFGVELAAVPDSFRLGVEPLAFPPFLSGETSVVEDGPTRREIVIAPGLIAPACDDGFLKFYFYGDLGDRAEFFELFSENGVSLVNTNIAPDSDCALSKDTLIVPISADTLNAWALDDTFRFSVAVSAEVDNICPPISGTFGAFNLDVFYPARRGPDRVSLDELLSFPVSNACSGSNPLEIVATNRGNTPVDSFQITYRLQGGATDSFRFRGSLGLCKPGPDASSDTLRAGSINLPSGRNQTLEVWVSSVNGRRKGPTDPVDTLRKTLSTGFARRAPQNLGVEKVRGTEATLTWDRTVNGISRIVWDQGSFRVNAGGNTIDTVASSLRLTGLSPLTTYSYYVKDSCAQSASSNDFAGPFTFTTECRTQGVPYREDFDASLQLDPCLTVQRPAGRATASVQGVVRQSPPNSLELDNSSVTSGDLLLVTPRLSALDSTKQLTFSVNRRSDNSGIELGTVSAPDAPGSFRLLRRYSGPSLKPNQWNTLTYRFQDYHGSDRYLAFRHEMRTIFDDVYLDDIVFDALPSCPAPDSIAISAVDTDAVAVSWQPFGRGGRFEIEYGLPGFALGNGIRSVSASPSDTLTGLASGTAYEVYVRDICAPGDTSAWTGPVAARPCVQTAPYFENFDNNFPLQSCWSFVNTLNNPFSRVGLDNFPAFSGSNSIELFNGINTPVDGDLLVVSPLLHDFDTLKQVSFFYYVNNPQTTLEIGTMADPQDPSSFRVARRLSVPPSFLGSWREETVRFPGKPADHRYVAFRHNLRSTLTGWNIDNFNYEQVPSCPPPARLSVEADSLTNAGAFIGWSPIRPATNYLVEYDTVGFRRGTGLRDTVSTNALSLSGLMPGTRYRLEVRQVCATGDTSAVSDSVTFLTRCGIQPPDSLPLVEDFESTSGTVSGGDSTQMFCRSALGFTFDSDEGGTSNPQGRVRWGTDYPESPSAGSGAMALDLAPCCGSFLQEATLTADLRQYAAETDLRLAFDLFPKTSIGSGNDVSIRGSEDDPWIRLLDWGTLLRGSWRTQAFDLDSALSVNGQRLSATFQLRFRLRARDVFDGSGGGGLGVDEIRIDGTDPCIRRRPSASPAFNLPSSAFVQSFTQVENAFRDLGIQSYRWLVNGTDISRERDLVYLPQDTLADTIALIYDNCFGRDTATQVLPIDTVATTPSVNFLASALQTCQGDTLDFRVFISNGFQRVAWEVFPDSGVAFVQSDSSSRSPRIRFEEPGRYDLRLTAFNEKGSGFERKNAYINVIPCLGIDKGRTSARFNGVLYDDGGPNGDYRPDRSGTQRQRFTIDPCSDSVIVIVEEFNLASGDFLRAYAGTDAATGTPLFNPFTQPNGFSGTNIPDTLVSPVGSMFIEFKSDDTDEASGFALRWESDSADFSAPTAVLTAADTACQESPLRVSATASRGTNLRYRWLRQGRTVSQDSLYTFFPDTAGPLTLALEARNCVGSDTDTAFLQVRRPLLPGYFDNLAVANATLPLGPDGFVRPRPALVDSTLSNVCNIASFAFSRDRFGCADLGNTFTLELSLFDALGNRAFDTTRVTIVDTLAPQALAGDTTLFLGPNGEARLTRAQVGRASTDNCGLDSLALEQSRFTCADLGERLVLLTAFDSSGNRATDTARIRVVDSLAPRLLATDTSVFLDDSGQVRVSPAFLAASASDNCTVDSLGLSSSQFACVELGPNAVVLSAFDRSGNASRDTAVVQVRDTLRPSVISLPADTQLCATDSAGAMVMYELPLASDNCGATLRLAEGPAPGDIFPTGERFLVFAAVDSAGNQRRDSARVRVFPLPESGFSLSIDRDTLDVTANDSALSAYAWAFGDGATASGVEAQHVYANEGTYTVRLEATSGEGCVDSSRQTVDIRFVGLAEGFSQWEVRLYPNPTDGNATLRFRLPEALQLRLGLYDLQGRRLRRLVDARLPRGANSVTIPAENLAEGLYLLRMQVGRQPARSFPLQKR